MFFVPDEAAPYFFSEMEKVAKEDVALSLQDNPRAYGIRAKKTGEDDRGIAYAKGIMPAAAAAGSAGALTGAATGRISQMSLLRKGEAAKSLEEGIRDLIILNTGGARAGTRAALEGGASALLDGGASALLDGGGDAALRKVRDVGLNADITGPATQAARTATRELLRPEMTDILKRRGKAALGAAGLSALSGAAGKLGLNAAQYETSKTLANRESEKVRVK
jgi:hypothetical protein